MKKYLPALLGLGLLLGIWELIAWMEMVPAFMLPAPSKILLTLISEWPILFSYGKVTLFEAFVGIGISLIFAFIISILMQHPFVYRMFYPLMAVSQTIPVVAIAPILVLWFGYGLAPKIILIVLVCFFPLTISLTDGYKSVGEETIHMIKALGASTVDIYKHVYFPTALPFLFSGLQVAISYGVVGAVIAEWLGGAGGLGAYMIQVRKAYAYDKMFAAIFLISAVSIGLLALVKQLEKRVLRWKYIGE